MFEKFALTAEEIQKAEDYIPIEKKIKFVEENAPLCVDRMNVMATIGEDSVELPPIYKENSELKSRFLLGFLLKEYFGIKYAEEDDVEYAITREEYDRISSSHIFNQLERMKSNQALRDKVFDLLSDYKDVEKRMNTEIYGILNTQNDPVARVVAGIVAFPTETIGKTIAGGIHAITDEIQKYKDERAEKFAE